jgi:tetratricopeptide (TPR) repeat protein
MPQDAFVVRNGKLSEVVVTTFTDGPHGAETPISELKRSFETIDVPADRYPETWWNDILSHYQRRSVAADILFPTAALGAVRDLARGSDTMLLLAGDKGFTDEAGFPAASGEPAFEFHAPNCFSQMVNFDAIGKYFEAKGGTALLPEKNLAGFGTCAFLRGRPCDRFGSTQRCYTDLQAGFGVDDLFAVMAWLNPHIEEMSLAQTLAVLRLSHWDTMTFLRVFPVLVRQARLAGVEREEIRTAVARVYSNYFPVSTADSALAFHCGVLLLEMHFYEEALETFEISTREMGPSAATSYNMGLCHAGAGRRPKALECMDEACDLDPSFEPAKLARKNLGNETR